MKTTNSSILLVEDDPSLGYVTKDSLEMAGFEVEWCIDGQLGLQAYQSGNHQVCILDVMLPKMDGFELAARIRQHNQSVPIIFLTAKAMEQDKLQGFRIGADDYVTKPFSMEELICRIEVCLKRMPDDLQLSEWELGEYTFSLDQALLRIGGQSIKLTRREAELLAYLCRHFDQLVKREVILKAVWGEDDYFKGRSLDVFISKLRKYLAHDARVDIINHHGIGFRLEVKK